MRDFSDYATFLTNVVVPAYTDFRLDLDEAATNSGDGPAIVAEAIRTTLTIAGAVFANGGDAIVAGPGGADIEIEGNPGGQTTGEGAAIAVGRGIMSIKIGIGGIIDT